MIDWLLQSIDPSRPHEVGTLLSLHGRLMVLAWGFLLPLGVFVARFYKVTPRQSWPQSLDNKFWWHVHLSTQNLGIAITVIGVIIILFSPELPHQSGIHEYFGWSITVLGVAQTISGYLRGTKGGPTARAADGSLRGDHYDMTKRRKAFEVFHKTVGYIAILLAIAAILTGMWQANAPRWFWLVLPLWWLSLFVAFCVQQCRGRTIDTYQAIWGVSKAHPGNLMKPIGIGIRRLSENDTSANTTGQDPE